MPRWRLSSDPSTRLAAGSSTDSERGSSSLEFIVVGMVLLVPLVYLVLTMAALQGGALAVEGAARHAARVFVQAQNVPQASARAERAVLFALTDAGIEQEHSLKIRCVPKPDSCLTRLGSVTATVGVTITLPLVPSALTLDVPLGIRLEATATQQVSRFAALDD